MKRRALATALAALCLPLAAQALTPVWSHTLSGSIDGYALGDVDGDGRLEAAVVVRGGTYAPGRSVPGVGSLALVDAGGALRWEVQTGGELAGFPTLADLDGDGRAEVAFCELEAAGRCRVLDGDGRLLWATGPLSYPGMTTVGPAAADVDGDGDLDLVVVSWGGLVAAYDGPSGALLWSYDAWAGYGDLLFGHASVEDLDGDGRKEIVFGGNRQGGLYALDAATGTLLWRRDLWTDLGSTFFASGPALVDLDGDGLLEIVVTLADGWIAAFTSTGADLWALSLPGTFAWSSPAAADLDGDLRPELVAVSTEGTVYLVDAQGTLRTSRALGTESWAGPSLLDADLDGLPEILAASRDTLHLLDGKTLQTEASFTHGAGGLMPTALAADIDGDGRTEVLMGSWLGGELLAFAVPVPSLFAWTQLAGAAAHPGRLDLFGDTFAGKDAFAALSIFRAIATHAASDPSLPGSARRTFAKEVLPELKSGLKKLFKGSPRKAIEEVREAIDGLAQAAAQGAATAHLQKLGARVALQIFQDLLARAQAVLGPTHAEILRAQAAASAALALVAAGRFADAARAVEIAAKRLEKKIRFVGAFCTAPLGEPYGQALCAVQALYGQVGGRHLERAMERLALAQADKALKEMEKAARGLAPPDADRLARIAESVALAYVEDAVQSGLPLRNLAAAQAALADGAARLAAGDPLGAIRRFQSAVRNARPR
ncbi:MAG: hypothetical protein D6729_16360 [Deltaproteobacteria bacterium]|nr:MAG: hypothetical protein D6729_16360 [Deltaproteobacteria bacterium]